jgi:hypothetical protein
LRFPSAESIYSGEPPTTMAAPAGEASSKLLRFLCFVGAGGTPSFPLPAYIRAR